MLERQRDIQYELANAYGYVDQKARLGGQKESASRLISLIKEMRSEYDKLSKSAYGYAKSEEKVRASFGDSWEAILKEAGVPKAFDFSTNAGEIAALERVRDYVKGNAKFAKDAWKDVQKVIDQLKTESEIEVQVRIREDFGRQMEEAFGNYELTLDLQKLNLPTDMVEGMFGIDETTIADLRSTLESLGAKLRDENGQYNQDAVKEYQKYLNKIDDLERKQQRDRIKDYAKYLEYELSERAKIAMDYTRKIAAVQAEAMFEPEQKQRIITGLTNEMKEKLAKQEWEEFKGSDVYVQMMEDLEKHGTGALATMREELEQIRDNAENLSPRALKEVINAIEKIKGIELDRSTPFVSIAEARKDLQDAMNKAGVSDAKNLFKQAEVLEKQRIEYTKQKKELEEVVGKQRLYNQSVEELKNLYKEDWVKEYFSAIDFDAAVFSDYDAAIENQKANEKEIKKLKNDRVFASEEESRVIDEQIQSIEEENNRIKQQIAQYKELIKWRKIYYGTDVSVINNKDANKDLDNVNKSLKQTEESAKSIEDAINAYDRFRKSIKKTLDFVKNTASVINPLFDNIIDNLDYLGGETTTLSAGWKEFGDTMITSLSEISDALDKINEVQDEMAKSGLAKSLMSGNFIAALVAIAGVIIKIVTAVSKIHDAKIDRLIEAQEDKIEDLKDAYERLERQIERTWDTMSYMNTYEQQIANIRSQISSLEARRAAANSRKKKDVEEIRSYERAIQEAYDSLDDLKDKQIEVFGGIGEANYRSWTEGFVDAWKSAFLETGDGLDALQQHFDEFLQEWFVKQATMRIAGKALESVMGDIDRVVSDDGIVNWNELQQIKDRMSMILPDLNEKLSDFAGMFDLGGEGTLSGLAAGIQGMTEEQANILEAYWNSVRMYTANIDINVQRIADILGAGGANTNPLLQQMTLIAANTQATHQLLQSVTKNGHSQGGYGIKVFND